MILADFQLQYPGGEGPFSFVWSVFKGMVSFLFTPPMLWLTLLLMVGIVIRLAIEKRSGK